MRCVLENVCVLLQTVSVICVGIRFLFSLENLWVGVASHLPPIALEVLVRFFLQFRFLSKQNGGNTSKALGKMGVNKSRALGKMGVNKSRALGKHGG